MTERVCDVLVIGAGQAGLTAAICAAENGCRVLLLEVSSRAMRGGNSRHTRNLRPLHEQALHPMEGVYGFEEYRQDLLRVTEGATDEELAELTLRESAHSVQWLEDRGVSFAGPLRGTLHLSRTNAFFLGGGKALVNALFRRAESLGVTVLYEARNAQLCIRAGRFQSATFMHDNVKQHVRAGALVAAAGGLQANLEWLREIWGEAADNFLIRGTPCNRGEVLRQLLAAGAQPVADPKQCHAVAVDARGPKFDGGIVTRIDCIPLGVVVNAAARRFHDEGEDFWPRRYAVWGHLVAAQENQTAWCIIDGKAEGLFMPTLFEPVQAPTIAALARRIGLNPEVLGQTISDFNEAVQAGSFDHQRLDDCHTLGLTIPKSHWARRIDQAPFRAWTLRPGITFSYLGVRVDRQARVQWKENGAAVNVFAAGEIMAGNVLGKGYLAGIGMTIGNVFGRVAGREAAQYVNNC